MQRLLGGSSRITWICLATGGDGVGTRLVLRMDPPGVSRPGSLVQEGQLMTLATNSGAPVPNIIMSSDDPGLLGAPFLLMEFVDGYSHPRAILREKALEKLRPQLAGMCGQALAKIHSIPVEEVPWLATVDVLSQVRTQLDQLGEPHPVFELAVRQLEATKPQSLGTTVVHGDFRNGNLIVGAEGIRGVIDWELSHIGDPMEDLGWLCVRSWRFGGPGPVGGFGTYNQLIFSYEHASGRVLDRQLLRWWELLCSVRWGVMTMMQAQAFRQGTHRSLDTALIGRLVCEVEWDVLALLSTGRKG
ncbi:MAG: phosphotransferase family protein [Acidimicrobiales bacterium]|nr:phosphotransferase family protein [Acidimicrobiales bacterium]